MKRIEHTWTPRRRPGAGRDPEVFTAKKQTLDPGLRRDDGNQIILCKDVHA
ncbi:MAG: hypothetical protein J0H27_09485 [Xanthomonadales bacterium]|nr:hypothetical protein [Xanthomonadales bacterium]